MTDRSYGTIALAKSKEGRPEWHIEASPSVMLRLRRLFTGTDRRGKVIKVSDTMEAARDIEWVLERFPMKVIAGADHLRARAEKHRESQEAVNRLLAAGYTPRDFDLAIPAREYQRIAAEMALGSRSLLLADEVGLGKTLSGICMVADPSARPALVVTLTHLPKQWEAEIEKFCPTMRVHRIRDGALYDIAAWGRRGRARSKPRLEASLFGPVEVAHRLPDVIVTSYSKLAKWADVLAPLVKSVIFDEVHELRKRSTSSTPIKKYDAAMQIAEACDLRVGLSATPIFNYGGEMYSVLSILAPGTLGTWKEFSESWCEGEEDKARLVDPKAFGMWARDQGLMLRRTRGDVGRELPSLQQIVHHVDVDSKPLEAIEGRAAELARTILALDGTGLEKMRAGGELDYRLRQATGLAKAPHVADFVSLLVESGEKKIVVFAWHHEVYAILAERLAAQNVRTVRYTGQESSAEKEAAKKRFVSGDAQVLLMSLRSGAGVDGLQAVCRTVVFAELDWSPGVHHQCAGRVHRDGQPDPVVAYYLVAESGSDPIVSDTLGLKRAQALGVVDPDAEAITETQIDPEHMKKLAASFLERAGGKAA